MRCRESHRAGHFEGSVADGMIQACELLEEYYPNLLLALMWASQVRGCTK